MSTEESRPGGDTETAIRNRADSHHHSTNSAVSAPPAAEDEIARLESELAEAKRESSAPISQAASDARTAETSVRPSPETLIEEAYDELREAMSGQQVGLRTYRDMLLALIEQKIAAENTWRKAEKLRPHQSPTRLNETTIVKVLLDRFDIVTVNQTNSRDGDELSLLAMYQSSGDAEGTYATSESVFVRLISELAPSMCKRDIESVIRRLPSHAKVVRRCDDPALSPVNNGIFNHTKQELESFSPERVFLSKFPIDYIADAPNPVITMPDGQSWDVESWITDLSDDEGVPELLWQIAAAALRPKNRWNRSPWLYGPSGRNGKGTYMELLRRLSGDSAATLSIKAFGEQFTKESLLTSTVVLSDENDVGDFVKSSADFKSVVTGDPIQIDRKNRRPVNIIVQGIVVACFNGFPRVRDKSESFNRRPLMVPFDKNFTSGERTYIKSDYLARPDVLRYVLRRALQMQHTALSEPEACTAVMDEFRISNNPVAEFWKELGGQFAWDLLPIGFLYDLFKSWFTRTHPSGIPLNRIEFTRQMKETLAVSDIWEFSDCTRPGSAMVKPEPLIDEYDLYVWMNSSYRGPDINGRCIPHPLKANYRCFVRK
ncbi:DNA primase family protein [Brevibacterium zhoupengii]|uniref:DNA primase family protein n=1 Tax=Brevibacterium zhoupengii TaxID=2898795 RepID=UPI001E3B42AE|nr:phage/plasmid primase, P4 family [Brevibacterium zhoupengii]